MLGYFFGLVMAFTAIVALAIGLFDISAAVNGSQHYPRPMIARTAWKAAQRHASATKQPSPAKDVSPVVATAIVETKKSKHHKPKVLARQPDTYGHGNALGYAQDSGYGLRDPFFR